MKISIITVCLNSEKTIEQTITSVLNQGYEDLEYIIIDGKSTDRTLEIVEKYKDSIAVVVSEKDEGLYDAMGKGIKLASGDVIGILNSDDWYEPGVLDCVNRCFVETGADAVYGRQNLIYDDSVVEEPKRENDYWVMPPHPATFYKRELHEKYGVYTNDYVIVGDYDMYIRIYLSGAKFQYVDKVIANFRKSGISSMMPELSMKEKLFVAKKYLPRLTEEERKYWEIAVVKRYDEIFFSRLIKNEEEFLKKIDGIVGFSTEIIIFGAGKWGTIGGDVLKKNGRNIKCYIDNKEEKWNKSINGIEVLPPEVLYTFEGTVLIMVKSFSQEILKQVTELQNPHISCITWEELGEKI